MYWYLSFLRPPPVSTSASSESITITPQVANDLRTEIRWEPTEVYYTWQRVHQSDSQGSQTAQHLTTFIPPDSTYRPLAVPLPAQVRPGQRWRLGLFPDASASSSQRLSNAVTSTSAVQVIGVWSEPIEITAGGGTAEKRETKKAKLDIGKSQKGKGKEKDDGPKQTRIRRQWLLDDHELGTDEFDNNRVLKIIEQTSYDLDKKIWDSGLALSAWLYSRLPSSDVPDSDPTLKSILGLLRQGPEAEALNVLELGSGTGLVSIALRSYLSRAESRVPEAEINATDLESAMELMNENIELNRPASQASEPVRADAGDAESTTDVSNAISLSARTLDWDDPLPDWVTANHPDLIVAADVTYNTASFPSLVNTLSNLMLPHSPETQRPPLLLAYKQRDEAERELWDMLKQKGIELTLVDKIAGAEEEGAVEIWAGKAITM